MPFAVNMRATSQLAPWFLLAALLVPAVLTSGPGPLAAEKEPETLRTAGLVELLNLLLARGQEVNVRHIYGHWRDLNDVSELSAGDVS